MDQDHSRDWRELCKAAATELDPVKLMHIISELTKALDERDKTSPSAEHREQSRCQGQLLS